MRTFSNRLSFVCFEQVGLALIICSIGIEHCQGQAYLPFPSADPVWSQATIEMGNYVSNERLGVIGDTLINGISYSQIGGTPDVIFVPEQATYRAAIRGVEDGKWYAIRAGQAQEGLIYDFSAEEGDLVTVDAVGTDDPNVQVLETDSIELLGVYRKRLLVDDVSGNFPEYWIEGIGSMNGLLDPALHIFDGGHELLCFKEEGDLVYLHPVIQSCEYIRVEIEGRTKEDFLRIVPHPVSGVSDMALTAQHPGKMDIQIYDAYGKLWVDSSFASGHFELCRSRFPPGLFTFRLINSGRVLHSSKFVVE